MLLISIIDFDDEEIKLISIAEDPFGNLYCYDFDFGKNEIVFQIQSKRQGIGIDDI